MIRCHFTLAVPLTTWKSDESDSNFRLGVELWIEGTLGYSLFPSISLATLAGNLVMKLFRVCSWTMQSQVRLIQEETQHKRRSYACSSDCCYSVAVVVKYFPLSPFPLQKTQTRHTNQSVSQPRRVTDSSPLKNIQYSRSLRPSGPLYHIDDNPSSARGSAQWLIVL